MVSDLPSSQLQISSLLPEHFQKAADIINESIQIGDATLWERNFSAVDIRQQVEAQDDREETFVLLGKDQVVGWGVIRKYSPKKGYDRTCETSVFLRRDCTGRGYGSYFKKILLDHCKALGYHHVLARILATNKVSIAYNEKLGYEIVGIQREVGYQNGRWVDVVIMQYIVPE
ncbi:MAG: GNAT family N-acetyltransferase [Saprospiraceae bacterium]|nr:GNAT family N-acetyltransferase [Saprospiraceae bacterium]